MAIRLRELRRPPGGGLEQVPGSLNAPERRSVRSLARICRLCTAVGIYVGVVIVLLMTWSNWRESRPRAVLDLGWQSLHEIRPPPSHVAEGESLQAVEPGPATPTFPPDRYLPLLPNKAPLVDMEVQTCFLGLPCNPPARDDNPHGLFGPWVRMERYVDSLLAESQGRINKATADDPASYTAPEKSSFGGLAALGALFPFSSYGVGGGGLSGLTGAIEQKWIFYRRAKVAEDMSPQRIVDMQLVQRGEQAPPGNEGWVRIKIDLRSRWMSGVKAPGEKKKQGPAHLYYRLDTSGAANETKLASITELDIIYGNNDPLPGFSFVSTPILPDVPSSHTVGSRLAVRRDPDIPPEVPTPITFREDGTFKVLQIADLHYSLSRHSCRDADLSRPWTNGTCIGEEETEKQVERWLDSEKPDLVVMSGDQLNGQTSSWDERSTIMRVLRPLIKRKILWATIGGNHDSQSGFLTRGELQSLYRQLPYSKTFAGAVALDDGTPIFGAANYYLFLFSPRADRTHLASLYFMDTGAHVPSKDDKNSPWVPSWMSTKLPEEPEDFSSRYGYIHPSQIQWFDRLSSGIKPQPRPYQPDTGLDLPPLWGAGEAEIQARETKMAKPPAILFQHIPIPEAFNGTLDLDAGGNGMVFGERRETASLEGAQARAGFFDLLRVQGQQSRPTPGTPGGTGGRDVQVIAHGHMHLNADCRRIEGVWICFSGGASLAGYGDPGFLRRARVFTFDRWGERISTHHVFEDGTKSDSRVLYEI